MTVGPDGDDVAHLRAAVQARGRGRTSSSRIEVVEHLCAVLSAKIGADVVVMALSGGVPSRVAGRSRRWSTDLGGLEAAAGEGPTFDVYRGRRPVLVFDLEGEGLERWPGYARAAREAGVASVYAFPVAVGAVVLGAILVCTTTPRRLTQAELRTMLSGAQVAIDYLLDGAPVVDVDGPLVRAVDRQSHIFQAQGMVMIQNGVTLDEALARMRAHAFAHDLDLGRVAADIVAGTLVLELDP